MAVRFAPTGPSVRTATLGVGSNDPVAARTVSLSGTGTAALISLKPTTLDLGKVKAGRSTTKTVNVTNDGTVPLTISSVTVDDTTAFSVSRGSCTTAVAPGRNCQISVTFNAQGGAGARTSTVRFVSNAFNPPTLRVTGTVG